MVSLILGVIVIFIAAFEWVGHVSVIHALSILTVIAGVSIILGGIGERGYRYTRL